MSDREINNQPKTIEEFYSIPENTYDLLKSQRYDINNLYVGKLVKGLVGKIIARFFKKKCNLAIFYKNQDGNYIHVLTGKCVAPISSKSDSIGLASATALTEIKNQYLQECVEDLCIQYGEDIPYYAIQILEEIISGKGAGFDRRNYEV